MTDSHRLLSPALRDYAARKYSQRTEILSAAGFSLPDDIDDPHAFNSSNSTGITSNLGSSNNNDRRTLMMLLAGTLPLADLLDRNTEILLDYVDHALMLRRERAWTAELPEDVFIHYVFWPRINNERLDTCRSLLDGELKPRVEGLSAERAVVETNYWCAEHLTYAPSDGRTLSAIGALNRGVGRCGEESTLLVSALRAIGIPARQVYTPRWAHCDDNHAWVEALVDGTWRFMGACEPEEQLDRGWFDHAAARAMLIHARVFCDYSTGTVDVSAAAGKEHGMLLENLTAEYAPVTRFTVTVQQTDGTPANQATVSFNVLNMAEFTPIATLRTDAAGQATIEVGKGSMMIHVSDSERTAECVVDASQTSSMRIVLPDASIPSEAAFIKADPAFTTTGTAFTAATETAETAVMATTCHLADCAHRAMPANGSDSSDRNERSDENNLVSENTIWMPITMIAPQGGTARNTPLTDSERDTGPRRAQQAEVTRAARFNRIASEATTGDSRLDALLTAAAGNWLQIAAYAQQDNNPDRIALLKALPVKDLADTSQQTLDDALAGACAVRDYAFSTAMAAVRTDERDAIWQQYVLCPRVQLEQLNGDRVRVQAMISNVQREVFRQNPQTLWNHLCKFVDDSCDDSPLLSDSALLRVRRGSLENVAITFVSICRALGIPARLDPHSGEPQYLHGSAFRTVRICAQTTAVPETPAVSRTSTVTKVSSLPETLASSESPTLSETFDAVEKRNILKTDSASESPSFSKATDTPRSSAHAQPRSTCLVLLAPQRENIPRYNVDYSISRLIDTPNGRDWTTLNLSTVPWHNGQQEITVDDGVYRIITTTRLPNGNQLAQCLTLDTRVGTQSSAQNGTDTQTDACTDMRIGTQTNIQVNVQTVTQASTQTDTRTHTPTGTQTDEQINTQTNMQTDTWTHASDDTQIDTQTNARISAQADTAVVSVDSALSDDSALSVDSASERTIHVCLQWREPRETELLEHLPVENVSIIAPDGERISLRDAISGQRTVMFVLDAHGSEPSIHVLDELRDMLERHSESQEPPIAPLIVLCPADVEPAEAIRRMLDRLPIDPVIYGCSRATAERLARVLFVDPDTLPLIASLAPCDATHTSCTTTHKSSMHTPDTHTPAKHTLDNNTAHTLCDETTNAPCNNTSEDSFSETLNAAIGVYACSGYNVGSVELATRLASMAADLQ